MIVLVPNTQDSWTDIDWSTYNFIQHLSTLVDPFDLPSAYYENIQRKALEEFNVPIQILWVDVDTFVQEPAGWDLDINNADLTAFVLKWR